MAKKHLKRTQFGKRALAGARAGKDRVRNADGTFSSVRTATYDIPGKKGRTDVMVAPTIRKVGGKMKQMTHAEARASALKSGDYVRVKGGKTQKKIEKARAKGDRKSKRFSKRLGKISRKR